jgi:hypothetical protein
VRRAAPPTSSPFFFQFLVIILSELFVQRTLDDVATAGAFIVLLFGWTYARAR